MTEYQIAKCWIVVLFITVFTVITLVSLDSYMYKKMADRGFCYAVMDRTNASATWTWVKCK